MLQQFKRQIYLVLGFVSLGLGVLGLFLPLLPTTCFIILAAWAFSKSSERFYQAIYHHKLFGAIVRDWQSHRAMSLKAKVIASLMIISSFGLSIYSISMPPLVVWLLLVLMLVLLATIALINTKPADTLHSAQ